MYLRKLKQKDAPLMLEWMHDPSVVENLQTDFGKKTIEDCVKFIDASKDDNHDIHLAIADAADEYQGTVSLKHIDNSSAEFAITIRSSAMGCGIATEAMDKMIQYGFEEKGLTSIYWCVSPENKRAVRFYDKNGYHRVNPDTLNIRGDCSKTQKSGQSTTICSARKFKQIQYNASKSEYKEVLGQSRGGYSPEQIQKYYWYLITREEGRNRIPG